MNKKKRTKIVATLGPATDDPKMLDAMIQAGMDVVRLNFSHGSFEEHKRRAELVRERARANGRQVGVIVDLQGPKIRTGRFKDGKVCLIEGAAFIIDTAWPLDEGNLDCVGTTYKTLPQDVKAGDVLLLDDGRVVFSVEQTEGTRIHCKVLVGGDLSNNKGINLKGGGLSAAALTDKDRADIISAAAINADYLAVSFPRSAADIHEARALLQAAGGKGGIIAKIERAEAMEVLDEIIIASDAVMIARGDLGVEIGDEALPPAQKLIICKARNLKRAVITATQMMESMIYNPIPTRAEVFDVANAVLDGTDAVMLSAETATGRYPHKAIEAMARVCCGAEQQKIAEVNSGRIKPDFSYIDESIAMAAMYAANHLHVRAIAALTESGSTPLWMSRISSGIPIYALSRNIETRRRVTLYRGVYPVSFDSSRSNDLESNQKIIQELKRQGAVTDGDLVVVTKGDVAGMGGGTNVMKILRVGSVSNAATAVTVEPDSTQGEI